MHQAGPRRLFLLSPASTSGIRAGQLFSPRAGFDLAVRVRSSPGVPIGEVFSFLSALYFRGKLAYARRFASPRSAIRVITSDRGLISPNARVTLDDLQTMARGEIDAGHAPYRVPVERAARRLARSLAPDAEVILLGSIATGKYADVLGAAFGSRLKFPGVFVGLGDMSRGGLLLRAVREERELEYVALAGATRSGRRPGRPPSPDGEPGLGPTAWRAPRPTGSGRHRSPS